MDRRGDGLAHAVMEDHEGERSAVTVRADEVRRLEIVQRGVQGPALARQRLNDDRQGEREAGDRQQVEQAAVERSQAGDPVAEQPAE